jgi:ribosomal protein S18 acetylase RimI-like enzyme
MFELRPADDRDRDFIWVINTQSLRPSVEATWGWDDAFQRNYFKEHYGDYERQIIRLDGQDVGVLSFETRADHVYVNLIAFLPQFQGQGLGTRVLGEVKDRAAALGLPVRLQVLKPNRARQLYERLGFRTYAETATHFQMACERGPMRTIVGSIEGEYRRYKLLGERAVEQLAEEQLSQSDGSGGNSIAAIVWHVSGNLASRFTDFLQSDGEKPWRDRDAEFAPRTVSRAELEAKWESGWTALFTALQGIDDSALQTTVTIRGVPLSVLEALHRSLSHTSYHVGQIVFLAKALRGGQWRWLTIPPGGSAAYNANPFAEKPGGGSAPKG